VANEPDSPQPRGRAPSRALELPPDAIVPNHLLALAALYMAARLDEAKLFAIVEQIGARFVTGALALQGDAARALLDWQRGGGMRMSEAQRREHFARAFGRPEFTTRWREFLRHAAAGRPDAPELADSGLALARDLTQIGIGMSSAAIELRQSVDAMLALLGHADLQRAFGERDAIGLANHVARRQLGGGDLQRGLTRGTLGNQVIRWLAANYGDLERGDVHLGELPRWAEALASAS
jgi:hypothetical protein